MTVASAADRAFRDALTAIQDRNYDRARPLLEKAAKESPDNASIWFWLAMASGSASAAMPYLRRALEIDPTHEEAGEALGRLLTVQSSALAQRNRSAAYALAVEAARVAPHLDVAWIALSTLSTSAHEVLDALRHASQLRPDDDGLRNQLKEALLREAVACAKNREKADARTLCLEATTIDPDDARAWTALVRLAETHGDAIEPLRHLLRLTPDRPGIREGLAKAIKADARAITTAGRKREAEARWREAIEIDDHDAEAWVALASVAADEVTVRRAMETAARLDPANPTVVAWIARRQTPAPKPAATAAAATTAAAAARPATPKSAKGHAHGTVMVVDDSATIRKILAITLEGAGYTVVAEPDGEHALARLADVVPDVILLDITMPKLDGYEVCKEIKKNERTANVPVVMLSGKDGFFDKVKGRVAGASEYITKPFQAPAVLAVIASHCGGGAGEVLHG